MKKTLSLILAVMMLLGCMSVTAFATTDNSTDITLTVAKALTYEMVIPEDVTDLSNFGIYSVGQAKVTNVKNATDKTVISYTAETADFKSEGKTDIPASYYTDLQGTNTFPTTAVEVYKNKADVASIPTMYVGISENDWNAAENGTYTATVTFNFVSGKSIPAGGTYYLFETSTLLSGDAGDVFPETPAEGDSYNFGDYGYNYLGDGWSAVALNKHKTEYGAILESILGKPIISLGTCFQRCESLVTAPEIPASVIDMSNCFDDCESLVTAPTIPAGVTNLKECFLFCYSLAGTIEINAENLTAYDSCFEGAGSGAGSVTLTGSCSMLNELAATNIDGYVVVGSN